MLDHTRIRRKQRNRRSPVVLFLLILLWSLAMGWGLSVVTNAQSSTSLNTSSDGITTVDLVPERYQLGQELYLENCAKCHIAIPPAVLPTQTWQKVLQDAQHYGVQLSPLVDPQRLLVWNYLRTFSRPFKKEEETPYRLNESRYFKALHPKVKLPRPVDISTCVSCHPNVADYNFRSLTPEWENAS